MQLVFLVAGNAMKHKNNLCLSDMWLLFFLFWMQTEQEDMEPGPQHEELFEETRLLGRRSEITVRWPASETDARFPVP